MKHLATPAFWHCYRQLPPEVRQLADKNFVLLQQGPNHPSLHFKRIDDFWSVRVGLHYWALARVRSEGAVWFWIGHHSEYDRLLKG